MVIFAASDGLTAGLILSSVIAIATSVLAYIKGRQGDHIVESANRADRASKAIDQALDGNQALIDDMREENAHWRQDALDCRHACEQLQTEYHAAMQRLGKVEMELGEVEHENESLRRHIEAQDAVISELRAQIAQMLEERT